MFFSPLNVLILNLNYTNNDEKKNVVIIWYITKHNYFNFINSLFYINFYNENFLT